YGRAADFREKFFRQLQLKLNDDPYFKTDGAQGKTILFPVQTIAETELSNDAKVLLAAAAESAGHILRVRYVGGAHVQAGGREFVEGNDRRSIARWEAAVDELEREGLVEDKTGKGELYFVTKEGYRVADGLPKAA